MVDCNDAIRINGVTRSERNGKHAGPDRQILYNAISVGMYASTLNTARIAA
jgi:hypothetical protein